MQLHPQVIKNAFDLYELHKDLAQGDDNARRTLTKMIIEQTIFDLPNEGYGWKSSSPTNPPSKDSIARLLPDGLIGWDLFDGTTRRPNDNPDSVTLDGQNFIPVGPLDHLGHALPGQPVDTGNTTPAIPDKPPEALLVLLGQIVSNQQATIDAVHSLQSAIATTSVELAIAMKELRIDVAKGVKIRF